MTLTPFHIAVQVRDIEEARRFYGGVIGCTEGRSSDTWVDFNLFGHQYVCHFNPSLGPKGRIEACFNPVDGHGVPVPHYGVVLTMLQWQTMASRLKEQNVDFVVDPYVRFKGQPGEQSTMFFLDPTGNALEFKAFQDIERQLFET